MIFQGQLINDTKQSISWLVCHVNHHLKKAALVNIRNAEANSNITKPSVFRFDDIDVLLNKMDVKSTRYEYPAVMSFSDIALIESNKQIWINKRDRKYKSLNFLTRETYINQYLYGKGIGNEIQELLIINKDSEWKSSGAYYNALNRFIVFGCQINALLPFKLKNTGKNYFLPDSPNKNNIKRGRCGADNRNSRSKSMGVTKQHKENLKSVIAYMKAEKNKKEFPTFTYRKAIEVYENQFDVHKIEREIDGQINTTSIPKDESECLSKYQVRYHLEQILDKKTYLKAKFGHIAYEKDHSDRQGSAHDGVIGATYRYEIDATVLDLYVRYPFDTSEQLSMGRPVLYFVIDVYSTMIVGFYLGFDGPNWSGSSQALVNACSDKVQFAARYGVEIEEDDWPAHHIPVQITVDNGNEHPDKLIKAVLKSELGIRGYNFTAVFRGDAKGTVESKFNCLNNQFIHFTPGAITKFTERGEQHPSNQAFWDYDSLVGALIHEIIYHNKSADRLHRLDLNAVRNNIDITPQALFIHSLHQEMNGGRDAKKESEERIRWAFLPEEFATVKADGIHLNGLAYYSDYAKKAGWFTHAKHVKPFKIAVKRLRTCTSHIWHKSESGQYVKFSLKNINNESPFIDIHWEPVLHLLERFKDKKHENLLNAKKLRLYKEELLKTLKSKNQNEINLAHKKNTNISIQKGIKNRQLIYTATQSLIHGIEYLETFGGQQDETVNINKNNELDSLDEELNN